jgi:hypothetical protein
MVEPSEDLLVDDDNRLRQAHAVQLEVLVADEHWQVSEKSVARPENLLDTA